MPHHAPTSLAAWQLQIQTLRFFANTAKRFTLINGGDIPLDIRAVMTMHHGKCSPHLDHPPKYLHHVHVDSGYGNSMSPGGIWYCLFLVDKCTQYAWVYGLKSTSGEAVREALKLFLVDCEGDPVKLHCDFDKRLLGGATQKSFTSQ